jgi:hypothetical protein
VRGNQFIQEDDGQTNNDLGSDFPEMDVEMMNEDGAELCDGIESVNWKEEVRFSYILPLPSSLIINF